MLDMLELSPWRKTGAYRLNNVFFKIPLVIGHFMVWGIIYESLRISRTQNMLLLLSFMNPLKSRICFSPQKKNPYNGNEILNILPSVPLINLFCLFIPLYIFLSPSKAYWYHCLVIGHKRTYRQHSGPSQQGNPASTHSQGQPPNKDHNVHTITRHHWATPGAVARRLRWPTSGLGWWLPWKRDDWPLPGRRLGWGWLRSAVLGRGRLGRLGAVVSAWLERWGRWGRVRGCVVPL